MVVAAVAGWVVHGSIFASNMAKGWKMTVCPNITSGFL
jgi:hypothetical protein